MVSPLCEVKNGSGSYGATSAGVDVTPGATITIRLADANVDSWEIVCATTDDAHVAATIQGGLTINSLNKTASFTAPSDASALRFRSRVNGGLGPDGVTRSNYSTTFCIYTLAGDTRVVAGDESTESGTFGWLPSLNNVIRRNAGLLIADLAGQGVAAPVYLTQASTQELHLTAGLVYTMRLWLLGSKVGTSEVATETHDLMLSVSGSTITILDDTATSPAAQNFSNQGWSVGITALQTSLRIACDPSGDTVNFAAHAEWLTLPNGA